MLTRRSPMKRTPFRSKASVSAGARSVPLARSGRVNPVRAEPRRQFRNEDPNRLAFLRTDVCGVALVIGTVAQCSGPLDPEHERLGVGMGQKADDSRTWTCCRTHHIQIHNLTGYFRGFDRDRIRTFRDERIKVSSIRYAHWLVGRAHDSL